MLKPSLCANARLLPMHARVDTESRHARAIWLALGGLGPDVGHKRTPLYGCIAIAPAFLKCVRQFCSVHVTAYGRKRESQSKKDLKRELQRTSASDIKQFEEEYRRAPEQYQLPCRLANLEDAELASVAVSALQKKCTDVNWLSDVFSAAQKESGGRMKVATCQLAGRRTEKRFHQWFSRSLPKVSRIKLPLVVSKKKKKVLMKPCSPCPESI